MPRCKNVEWQLRFIVRPKLLHWDQPTKLENSAVGLIQMPAVWGEIKVVSSGYFGILWEDKVKVWWSATNMMNKTGPIQEPWTMLRFIDKKIDKWPLYITAWDRERRKSISQRITFDFKGRRRPEFGAKGARTEGPRLKRRRRRLVEEC